MAVGAYQTTNFAYQGAGAFAYQESAPEPPIPEGLAPGSGHPVDWQVKRRKLTLKERPEAHLRSILDKVIAEYYGEIIESDAPKAVKTEAATAVRPFVQRDAKGSRLPAAEKVDWERLELDASAVAAIIRIWRDEVSKKENEDDDDDFIFMMLS
jgi:hypothetical protein